MPACAMKVDIKLKKIRATDKLLSSTKDKVAGFINCTYLADDAEFDTSENIADNKKRIL